MQQYFVSEKLKITDRIRMNDEQTHHIRNVMRMRTNERIRLADVSSHLYFAHVEIVGNEVYAVVEEEVFDNTCTPVNITLAQCLIKKDKWDFLLQKSAELGVSCIQPFVSSRCVIKEKEDRQDKKMVRWNKILQEACEQCKRSTLVDLKDTCSINELKNIEADVKLIAYEDADQESNQLASALRKNRQAKSVVIVIGCEGGFSKDEVEDLESVGFLRVSLGGRILRAETAAMASINSISFFYEMEGVKE